MSQPHPDPRFSIHNVTVMPLVPSYLHPVRQLTHSTKYIRSTKGVLIRQHARASRRKAF